MIEKNLLGKRKPRILFASVFGPYSQDDAYGSRAINPMELYHNQVTRFQGPFSLRMFHRSWGLMLMQANIQAPSALLDFPTRERFIEELRTHPYDIVAISAIPPNFAKAREMCRLVREYLPQATLVVGGHIAGMPKLRERLGADHVVRGEGVRWFREFLGEDTTAPILHPRISSGIGAHAMGLDLGSNPRDVAATLIPSVGCPMGCNFCSTSAMFGGKGRFINFYETGDELYAVMADLERAMKIRAFFVMDENFLLHKKRALRLLELMRRHGKSWSLYVFSSANVLRTYSMEQIVGLGISWVWMGLEGKDCQYSKLDNIDTRLMVQELQSHGVRVLGSTIIGLEEHTPENLDAAIDYAVSHNTEFHQFMLYTPVPGTPLFEEHLAAGTLLDPDCLDPADSHGQLRFSHRHPHIPPGLETQFLQKAFLRDFEINGPSIVRLARTTLQGWLRYRKSPDLRVRKRFLEEARDLAVKHAGALWASRKWFRHQPELSRRISQALDSLYRYYGIRSRLLAPLAGRIIYRKLKEEEARLLAGITYEPPTFYEIVRGR